MKTINFFKTALLTIALFVCGNVGAQTAYASVDFTTKAVSNSNYTNTWNYDGWEIYGAANNRAEWDYVRVGGKNTASNKTGSFTSPIINTEISSLKIEALNTASGSGFTMNNITLKVASDAEFTNIIDEVLNTEVATSMTFLPSNGNNSWPINSYYKLEFNWSSTSGSNRGMDVQKVELFAANVSSVATPTFSIKSGKYANTQSVYINCANTEATIYYTINGDDPTTTSFVYDGSPITISTTTTLKAIAVENEISSNIASAIYTFPTEVNSINAFYTLADETFTKITSNFTVIFVNGGNVYVQDASGSMLIFDYTFAETEGLTNETVISNIVGTKTNYNGASQMQNIQSHTVVGNGSAINPTTVTELTVADVHKYVKLEDAQFDNTYNFTESSTISTNLSTHGNIVVRNHFRNFTMDVNATDKYDIVGFVSVYNNAPQIYPVSITITTPSFMTSTDALEFEEVGRDQTKTLEFTLQGVNLTEDVTLNLSGTNAGYFEYTPQSISVDEDGSIEETTISVTYKPTELGNNHTATLTIASSGLNKTITLQGSCIKTVLPTPVATEATAITVNGFTANWEAVENATSYEVNVWTEEEPAFSVANSSFENGLENWVAEEGYSLSTDNAHTGSQSLAFAVNSTKDLRQTIENLTPGEEITLSYWYYLNETSSGNGLRFWCSWVGNDDHSALQPTTYSNEKGAWTQATITTTVPEGATALNLEIRVYNGAKGYIDDITVTPANGNTITPITGSPFTVEGATSKEITGLTAETTYYYNVVAKAEGYTASEASNTVEVKTLGEPTYAITGEGVTFDEATGYTLELGEVVLNDVTKEFTLTASNYNSSISLSTTRGLWKLAETAATGDLYTFTPDENGSINANLTVSFKTTEEMMGTTIEDLINYGRIAYGSPQTEQWAIIIDGKIDNYLYISFTPTEESTGTGLCNQPEMEGVTFNGEEIINSLNLDVVVYNAIGQMVVRSNENINMSSYPAGVYVIKAANGESMKIVK